MPLRIEKENNNLFECGKNFSDHVNTITQKCIAGSLSNFTHRHNKDAELDWFWYFCDEYESDSLIKAWTCEHKNSKEFLQNLSGKHTMNAEVDWLWYFYMNNNSSTN